jgi:hypothetical protein
MTFQRSRRRHEAATWLIVFGALLVLTVLTVAVSYLEMPPR